MFAESAKANANAEVGDQLAADFGINRLDTDSLREVASFLGTKSLFRLRAVSPQLNGLVHTLLPAALGKQPQLFRKLLEKLCRLGCPEAVSNWVKHLFTETPAEIFESFTVKTSHLMRIEASTGRRPESALVVACGEGHLLAAKLLFELYRPPDFWERDFSSALLYAYHGKHASTVAWLKDLMTPLDGADRAQAKTEVMETAQVYFLDCPSMLVGLTSRAFFGSSEALSEAFRSVARRHADSVKEALTRWELAPEEALGTEGYFFAEMLASGRFAALQAIFDYCSKEDLIQLVFWPYVHQVSDDLVDACREYPVLRWIADHQRNSR